MDADERDRVRDIDQRVTHLFEHLEAVEADPTLERGGEPGVTAALDQLEAELREIQRVARELLTEDADAD
jgi:hypothetical protein